MSRLWPFSLSLLVLSAVAPHAAIATCPLAHEQVVASEEFRIASTMVASHQARARAHLDLPAAPSLAVHAGHMLAGQVRYLGKSAHRRTMFDCIYEQFQRAIARTAIETRLDPIEADAVFKKAAHGMLEDADLVLAGVDPRQKYPPIFDMGIAGIWRNARSPQVGMLVEETEDGRYRCRSFGAVKSGAEGNCVIQQVGAYDFVMSFVMPPSGMRTQPQDVRIPLHREGDRLATPGPDYSLIYDRDRSAEGG